MQNTTRAAQQPQPLTAQLVARLAAENIHSLAAWRALGRRRTQIFGIVPSVVRQLDALARAERRRHRELRTLAELIQQGAV